MALYAPAVRHVKLQPYLVFAYQILFSRIDGNPCWTTMLTFASLCPKTSRARPVWYCKAGDWARSGQRATGSGKPSGGEAGAPPKGANPRISRTPRELRPKPLPSRGSDPPGAAALSSLHSRWEFEASFRSLRSLASGPRPFRLGCLRFRAVTLPLGLSTEPVGRARRPSRPFPLRGLRRSTSPLPFGSGEAGGMYGTAPRGVKLGAWLLFAF